MKAQKLRVATRKSELALAQCRQYLASLEAACPGLTFEEIHIVTTGDKIVDRPLAEVGGKGLFLKEIEEALVAGEADIAVHSMKDVPPDLHPNLAIGCIPVREDARDALVTFDGRRLEQLEPGSKIGTSSLRRGLQIRLLRPDIEVVGIRGNVGTRIAKCRRREVDATLLACAGVNRLGLQRELAQVFSPEECLPAVGQGALAIEYRRDAPWVLELLLQVHSSETAVAAQAERGVMRAVEGDCKTPVAAYACRVGGDMWLRALLARPDESGLVRAETRVIWPASEADAARLGEALGAELRAKLEGTTRPGA
jgi:hydroxymethylbilane synthase